jgi:hypothetical protein
MSTSSYSLSVARTSLRLEGGEEPSAALRRGVTGFARSSLDAVETVWVEASETPEDELIKLFPLPLPNIASPFLAVSVNNVPLNWAGLPGRERSSCDPFVLVAAWIILPRFPLLPFARPESAKSSHGRSAYFVSLGPDTIEMRFWVLAASPYSLSPSM